MGYTMDFNVFETPPQAMKGRYDALMSQYKGKYYETADEMRSDLKIVHAEIREIYKDSLQDYSEYDKALPGTRYDAYSFMVIAGMLNSLMSGSKTPEERAKWEGFSSRYHEINDRAGTEKAGWDLPIEIEPKTDDYAHPGTPNFMPPAYDGEFDQFFKDLSTELENSLQSFPQAPSSFAVPEDEVAYQALNMRTLLNTAKVCLIRPLSDNWAREDEQRLVQSYGGWYPKSPVYKSGTPGLDLTRAVRTERLMPFRRLSERASDTEVSLEEYQKKAKEGKTAPSDEMDIRRKLLENGVFMTEAIEMMRLNGANERIKSSFPVEIEQGAVDLTGDRGKANLSNNLAAEEARRRLIGSGYPMTDVEALGRTAIFVNQLRYSIEENDDRWAKHEYHLAENVKRRKQNETLPESEQLELYYETPPIYPRYTEEQRAQIDNIGKIMDQIFSSNPGSAENRKDWLQKLQEAISGMDPDIAKRHRTYTGVNHRLNEALNYVPSDLEKEYLANPEPMKALVDSIPVRHYTEDRQREDISWLDEKEAKDRELGDIWKEHPWEGELLAKLDSISSNALKSAYDALPEAKAGESAPHVNVVNSPAIAQGLSDIMEVSQKLREGKLVLVGELREKGKNLLQGPMKDVFDSRLKAMEAFQKEALPDDPDFIKMAGQLIQKGKLLENELDSYQKGTEYTLQSRAGVSPDAAVKAFSQLLSMNDSFFHWDSSQFKAVKENLVKVGSGKGTRQDLDKLTRDVKTWLTDPSYDRKHKHTRNEFDNNRFCLMFALANELDPAWAKENFGDMNITGLHGERAEEGAFHHIEDFVNYLHGRMADKGFFPEKKGLMDESLWKTRGYAHGDKAIYDDIIRSKSDPEYTDEVRLSAERNNLSALLDFKDFAQKFPTLNTYKEQLMNEYNQGTIVSEGRQVLDKDSIQALRQNALTEVKNYVSDPKNQKNKDFKQSLAAFSVLDPVDAYAKVVELKNQANKEVSKIGLRDFEKMGLDLGGRKRLKEEKEEKRDIRRNQNQNQNQAMRGPGH